MLTPSAAPNASFSASRSISIPARSPAIYASSCQRCWPYKCSHPILSPITHLHSFALGRLGCSRALAQLAHSLDQVALDDLDARMLVIRADQVGVGERLALRSEEHTSELQSLMRISYAVFCLKKKQNNTKRY